MPNIDRSAAVTVHGPTPGPHYPNSGAHVWGEFACLAVEFGGYGDITAVDPYDGRRLHAVIFSEGVSIYDALRRLVDEMEQVGFLTREPRE